MGIAIGLILVALLGVIGEHRAQRRSVANGAQPQPSRRQLRRWRRERLKFNPALRDR